VAALMRAAALAALIYALPNPSHFALCKMNSYSIGTANSQPAGAKLSTVSGNLFS
jgi:hypothetical protein